jgi:hypothetical protein
MKPISTDSSFEEKLERFKAIYSGKTVRYIGNSRTITGNQETFSISWNNVDCTGKVIDVIFSTRLDERLIILLVQRQLPDVSKSPDEVNPYEGWQRFA